MGATPQGTYEDVEAVPVEVTVAVQTVPPAVAPRPGEEAEQQQVPEHGPHGDTGTGSGCGTGERKPRQTRTAPAPPSPAPAPKCGRSQPVLPHHLVPLPKISFWERSPTASSSPKWV